MNTEMILYILYHFELLLFSRSWILPKYCMNMPEYERKALNARGGRDMAVWRDEGTPIGGPLYGDPGDRIFFIFKPGSSICRNGGRHMISYVCAYILIEFSHTHHFLLCLDL